MSHADLVTGAAPVDAEGGDAEGGVYAWIADSERRASSRGRGAGAAPPARPFFFSRSARKAR